MTQQSESQAMAHEATLFVMQMAGDSMINAGIQLSPISAINAPLAVMIILQNILFVT